MSSNSKATRPARIALAGLLFWWLLFSVLHWGVDLQFPLAIFHFASWDEYQFLPVVHMYQEALIQGGIRSFLLNPEPFGYGNLFWQLYALLTLPFYFVAEPESSLWLFCLRLITLTLQIGTGIVAWKCLRLLRSGPTGNIWFVLLLLPMSGLLLLYKPFSPDYLGVFLMVAALYAALRLAGPWLFLALFVAGLATAVKIYNILLVPIIVLLVWKKLPRWALGTAPVLLALGFVCGNLEIISTGWVPFRTKLLALSAEMNNPDYMHAIQPPGTLSYMSHWLYNPAGSFFGITSVGITREYFFWTTLLFGLIGMWTLWRTKRWEAFVIGAGAWAALLISIITTNRVWTWYILTPVVLLTIAMAVMADSLETVWQRRVAGLVLGIHVIAGLWYTAEKSHAFLQARFGQELKSKLTFYRDCVRPQLPILTTLPEKDIACQFYVPVFSMFRRQSVCVVSGPINRCFGPETKVVLLYRPDPADEHALANDYTCVKCSANGVMYLRNSIPQDHPLYRVLQSYKSEMGAKVNERRPSVAASGPGRQDIGDGQ